MSIFVPGVESNSILYTSYCSQSDDSLTSYERMHQSAVAYRDFELFMSKQCAVLNIGLDGCSDIARMVDYLDNSGSTSAVAQLYDLRLYTADGSDYIVGVEGLGDMLSKAWEFIVTTIKKIISFVGRLFGLSSKSVDDTHKLVSEDSDKLGQISEETAKEMQQMPEGATPKGFFAKVKAYLTGGKANTIEEAIKEAQGDKDLKKGAMEASKELPYYGKEVYDEIKLCHGNIGMALNTYVTAVNTSITKISSGNYKGKDITDATRYEEAGNELNQQVKGIHQGVKLKSNGNGGYDEGNGTLSTNVARLHTLIKNSHDSVKKLSSPFARYDLRFIRSAFADVDAILSYLKANPLSTVSDKLTSSLKELEGQINILIVGMRGNVQEKSRTSAQKSLNNAKRSVSALSQAVVQCKDIVTKSLEVVRADARFCHTVLSDMQQYQSLRSKLITGAKDLFRKSDTYKPETRTKYENRVADKYAANDDLL